MYFLFCIFVLCDISLILASDVNKYNYEWEDSRLEHGSRSKRSAPDTSTHLDIAQIDGAGTPYQHASGSEGTAGILLPRAAEESKTPKRKDKAFKKDGRHEIRRRYLSFGNECTLFRNIGVNPPLASNRNKQMYTLSTTPPETSSSAPTQRTSVEPGGDHVGQGSYAPEITNDTLKEHNITNETVDSHIYYTSWRKDDTNVGQHYWVDLNNRTDSITHGMLSASHRRAVTVPLPFKFLFYGHEIDNVTIATGGFLYTGDYIHSWLAATQYIAPLMANFDTSLSNDSNIRYASNSTTFTVLWENVALQEKPHAGNFTFEATLCKNGDIIFVYKNIPNITNELTEEFHPVKVGLSDAYIVDKSFFFVRRKTIFEYHRVHFDKKDLKNWTVIYLKPTPTCNMKTTCESCLAKNSTSNFDCQWCDGRCSTGYDRKRQEWMKKDCEKRKLNETKYCQSVNADKIPTPGAQRTTDRTQEKSSSKSVVFMFLLAVIGISIVVGWSFYAYRNPHSTSGQILIRYRPSRWSSWRKGEARYTAATIHM